MALHRLLLWFLGVGAVVFVGAAGATVYQVLAPRHARVAAVDTPGPLPDATPSAPVVTAVAEPRPVAPATAPTAPPGSAPQAALPPSGKPAARPVVAARQPIHRPARLAIVMVQRPIPRYPPPPAVTYAYPGYAYYAGYPAYGYYRPYAYYRVY
jgi:hypothetical protein